MNSNLNYRSSWTSYAEGTAIDYMLDINQYFTKINYFRIVI